MTVGPRLLHLGVLAIPGIAGKKRESLAGIEPTYYYLFELAHSPIATEEEDKFW